MSRSIAVAAVLALIATLLWHTLLAPVPNEVFDVHAFVAAGKLVIERGLPVAYRDADVAAMQFALSGYREHLPWTYPPATTALVTPLGLLAIPQAHFLIGALSLAAVLAFIHVQDIAPAHKHMALFLATPPLLQAVSTGTPAPLFATLVACALARATPLRLAAVTLKPHIALGIGIPLLFSSEGWRRLAIGAAIASAATLAIESFAPGTLRAFLVAIADARNLLAAGYYPLHRMASPYAFFRQFLGVGPAALAHALVAATVLAVVLRLLGPRLRETEGRIALLFAGLLLPPYVYDYDLVLLGLALALLPHMPAVASPAFWTMLAAVLANIAFNALGLTAAGLPPPTFAAIAGTALLLAREAARKDPSESR